MKKRDHVNMNVIALDLEGTLISNAMSQIPRPWLGEFLEACKSICPRVVIFTTVNEPLFRNIARVLVEENVVPHWFCEIEYVNWVGPTKNLEFISSSNPKEVVLVDDFHIYIHPGQESSWIEIKQFEYPYQESELELQRVFEVLKQRSLNS